MGINCDYLVDFATAVNVFIEHLHVITVEKMTDIMNNSKLDLCTMQI